MSDELNPEVLKPSDVVENAAQEAPVAETPKAVEETVAEVVDTVKEAVADKVEDVMDAVAV